MKQHQQKLETITRFEADRLVNNRIFGDKVAAVTCSATAASAMAFAYLWNKYVAAQKVFTSSVQNFMPQSPDLDYDKILIGFMALLAAYVGYLTGEAIHSAVTSRKHYNSNSVDYIRKTYKRDLVQ